MPELEAARAKLWAPVPTLGKYDMILDSIASERMAVHFWFEVLRCGCIALDPRHAALLRREQEIMLGTGVARPMDTTTAIEAKAGWVRRVSTALLKASFTRSCRRADSGGGRWRGFLKLSKEIFANRDGSSAFAHPAETMQNPRQADDGSEASKVYPEHSHSLDCVGVGPLLAMRDALARYLHEPSGQAEHLFPGAEMQCVPLATKFMGHFD